jgi:hypothetical protein
MATYNAESALDRMITPHYTQADDETRTLLREIYTSPADLEMTATSSTFASIP